MLDENNIVVQVIVGIENNERDWEDYYGGKRTSYNTPVECMALGVLLSEKIMQG